MPMTAGERKKLLKDLNGNWWRLDREIPDEAERAQFVWDVAREGLVDDVQFCNTLGNHYDPTHTQTAGEYLSRISTKVTDDQVYRGVRGWDYSLEWLMARMAQEDPQGLATLRDILPPMYRDFSTLFLAHNGALAGELPATAKQRLAAAWAATTWDEDWYAVRDSISDDEWSALVLESICDPEVTQVEWERVKDLAPLATVAQAAAIVLKDGSSHVRAHARVLLSNLQPVDFDVVTKALEGLDPEDYYTKAKRGALATALVAAHGRAGMPIPADLLAATQADLSGHGTDDLDATLEAIQAIQTDQREQLLLAALRGDGYGYIRAVGAASTAPTPEVLEALLTKIESVDQDSEVPVTALAGFGELAVEPLLGLLGAPKVGSTLGAIYVRALGAIGSPAAAPTLVELTGASTKGLRMAATAALEALGADALDAVKAGVGSKKKAVREACAALLAVLEMPGDNPVFELEKKAAALSDAAFDQAFADLKTASTHSSNDHEKLTPFAASHGVLIAFAVRDWFLGKPEDWRRSTLWQGLVEFFAGDEDMAWIAADTFAKLPPKMYTYHMQQHAVVLARMAKKQPEAVTAAIVYSLKGSPPAYKAELLEILLRHGVDVAADVYLSAMQDTSKTVREHGVEGVSRAGVSQLPAVMGLLASKKKDVRMAAADALTRLPATGIREQIKAALDAEKTAEVRTLLEQALAAAGGNAFEFPGDDGASVVDADIDAFLAALNQPKLAAFVDLGKLSLRFADSGVELSPGAKHAFVARLMKEDLDNMDEVARRVRPFLDDVSANEFSIALKDAWASSGAASKDKWAIFQQAILASPRRLNEVAPMLDHMAQNSNHHLARWYVEVLYRHGSVGAHSWLAYWAKNGERSSVVETAQACLEKAAIDAGLSADNYSATLNTYIADDVADQNVPRLGLDEVIVVDYGPRAFEVRIDQNHELVVRDPAEKKALKSLPKPRKDETLEDADKTKIADLKKQLRGVVKEVTARLEAGMISGRPWKVSDFRELFLGHPILTPFAGRLVFRADDGKLFRVSESEFLDADYDAVEVADTQTIRIAHPLEMSSDEFERWGEHLADAEVIQPFDQLGRATFTKDDDPFSAKTAVGRTTRGAVAGRLRRLGWRKGWAEDAGIVYTASRLLAGRGVRAWMEHGGFYVGDPSWDADEEIEVSSVTFHDLSGNELALEDVDPLAYSEIRWEVTQLLA